MVDKLLRDEEVDVAVFQETKLSKSVSTPKTPGYTCLRLDRAVHRGVAGGPQGGLAILVRDGLPHDPLPRPPGLPVSAALEVQGVRVSLVKEEVDVWNLYRPPTRGADDHRDGRLHALTWPATPRTLICGDLNAHGVWDPESDPDDLGEEVEDFADSRSGSSAYSK